MAKKTPATYTLVVTKREHALLVGLLEQEIVCSPTSEDDERHALRCSRLATKLTRTSIVPLAKRTTRTKKEG